jgi:hypothetical protein
VVALSSFVAGRCTRYSIYERRLDLKKGILSQDTEPIWVYDIVSLTVRRSPVLTLTGTASIEIDYEKGPSRPGHARMIAVGSYRHMTTLLEELQERSLHERRAMKKQFI